MRELAKRGEEVKNQINKMNMEIESVKMRIVALQIDRIEMMKLVEYLQREND